jgi:RecA/RadA recombinase
MLLGYIQKTQKDVIVVYLDSENSMTFQRMSNLGLNDLDKILYLQPSTLDEGYQMIYDLLKQ